MKVGDMVVRAVDASRETLRHHDDLYRVRTNISTGIVTEIDLEYGRHETLPGTPPGFYKVVWQHGGYSWYRSNQVEVISENR